MTLYCSVLLPVLVTDIFKGRIMPDISIILRKKKTSK